MYALVRRWECLVKSLGTPRCDAPYGAWRFLAGCRTRVMTISYLNAPYGARCFLTQQHMQFVVTAVLVVLMHLVVLGAF